jgi:hypothetical protein
MTVVLATFAQRNAKLGAIRAERREVKLPRAQKNAMTLLEQFISGNFLAPNENEHQVTCLPHASAPCLVLDRPSERTFRRP